MSLGRNIRVIAFDKGISHKQLAEAAEMSEAMFSKIIHGEKTPSVPKLIKIAKLLGVTVDELLKEKEV